MDLSDLKSVVAATSAPGTARSGLAGHYMNMLEEALKGLASLGHNLHLVGAPSAAPAEFPKMLYHVDYPDPVVVNDESEQDEMESQGWMWHPSGEEPVDVPAAEAVPEIPMPPAPMLVHVDLATGPPTDVNNLHPVGPV